MNAFIHAFTRASYNRRRDLIAPTVSKMTPKMTSKMTPKMTSGTPSGALWSNPSPEGLDKGSGGPNAYKTTEKPPPEPVRQEGRKARRQGVIWPFAACYCRCHIDIHSIQYTHTSVTTHSALAVIRFTSSCKPDNARRSMQRAQKYAQSVKMLMRNIQKGKNPFTDFIMSVVHDSL